MSYTLSDKNSQNKSFEILAWCRKFCPTKNYVRRKFCLIFQYKIQAKIRQKCRNLGLVSKIVSDKVCIINSFNLIFFLFLEISYGCLLPCKISAMYHKWFKSQQGCAKLHTLLPRNRIRPDPSSPEQGRLSKRADAINC